MFHAVADRYDLMNDLMSFGIHRLWKDIMVTRLSPPRSGTRPYRVLDMAGGTGDIAERIINMSHGYAEVTVSDINTDMLRVGAERAKSWRYPGQASFVEANAEELPFEDESFDAYTIAFGIRNVPRIDMALKEAHRVLKRGGRFLCLEFSTVDIAGFDRALRRVLQTRHSADRPDRHRRRPALSVSDRIHPQIPRRAELCRHDRRRRVQACHPRRPFRQHRRAAWRLEALGDGTRVASCLCAPHPRRLRPCPRGRLLARRSGAAAGQRAVRRSARRG